MTSTIKNTKDGGMMFEGVEAVRAYSALALRSGLSLLSKGITPTRGLTVTKALKIATTYTGKTYKRTEIEQARADLVTFADEMKKHCRIEKEV